MNTANYHKILSEILKSFRESQDIGICWDLEYPKSCKQMVKLFFPLTFCIVDMKGGKQLCAQYGANNQVERPCISCYCSFDKLDNATVLCTPVNGIEMEEKIKQEDETKLAKVSQHKVVNNAFLDLILPVGCMEFGECVHPKFYISITRALYSTLLNIFSRHYFLT